MIILKIVVC